METEELVVLVTPEDYPIGLMPKLEAHQKRALHRAISVFLFNDKGEMLLQQRSAKKYHSPSLWTNACCSHPRAGESYEQAAKRRLFEELGIVDIDIALDFHFIYSADVGQGLWEHELDYVFVGKFNDTPNFNPEEVETVRWVSIEEIDQELNSHPESFTEWFKIIWREKRLRLLQHKT